MNNVPDPLLAARDLPTFKFALEKSEAKVIGNSSAREATARQLPISKGIAGVSMTLAPGDMRELHGHSLENVGDEKCRVLIGFNSGIYEDIDLSEWIAGNPTDVLATNFGRPEALFQRFPRRDVFIADGKHAPAVSP